MGLGIVVAAEVYRLRWFDVAMVFARKGNGGLSVVDKYFLFSVTILCICML